MNRIALMPDERRNELFALTAERRGMSSGAVAEKDFWVTGVLGRLFASPLLGSRILFKGGMLRPSTMEVVSSSFAAASV